MNETQNAYKLPDWDKVIEMVPELKLAREKERDFFENRDMMLAYYEFEHRRGAWKSMEKTVRTEATKKGLEEGMQQGMQKGLEKGKKLGLKQGRAEGRAEGLEEGREQGLEEGRAEGHADGVAENQRFIVQNMKKQGFEISVITQVTGLDIPQIEAILASGQ